MSSVESQWDQALEDEPADWSHLYLELRLADAERLEEAALVLCPLNPWHGATWRSGAIRFRISHRHGYGASHHLARALFAKLDARAIAGDLAVLEGFDSVLPVGTQGPL